MATDQPGWLDSGRLRWAWWAWEPFDAYRRSGGVMATVAGSAHWLAGWYDRIHSEDTVKRMADTGINLAVTHFFKGFGLDHEKADMRRTAALTECCHRHGIRVIGYLQFGSIFYEQFFEEMPEAREWLELDSTGKPRTWLTVYYRYRGCCRQPSFLEYLARCVRFGLNEVGLDGVHFDNAYSLPCYCSVCRQAFRAYLHERHPNPRERFGLSTFAHVEIPPENTLDGTIHDPLVQEWIRFRGEGLNKAMAALKDCVRECNPEAALIANPCVPRGFTNLAAARGCDPATYGKSVDMIWAENGQFPRIEDGCLLHQAHAFRLAEAAGYVAVPTTWMHNEEGLGLPRMPREIALSLAETAAFGGLPGMNWALRSCARGARFPIEDKTLRETATRYLQFFAAHEGLYAGTRSKAQVALLHSSPTLTFNRPASYACFVGMEQICVQKRIPAGIVFDTAVGNIRNYDLVILPHVVCLSAGIAETLREYVRTGGRLLVTGATGDCDNDFRQYAQPILDDLRENRRVTWLDGTPERADNTAPSNYSVKIRLPKGANRIADAIAKALGDKLLVAVDAPDTVTTELRENACGPLLHLVNYRNAKPVRGLGVSLRSDLLKTGLVTLFDPDRKQSIALKARKIGGRWELRLPPFSTYVVLVPAAPRKIRGTTRAGKTNTRHNTGGVKGPKHASYRTCSART